MSIYERIHPIQALVFLEVPVNITEVQGVCPAELILAECRRITNPAELEQLKARLKASGQLDSGHF